MTEPGMDGIDFGDLPDILARVASEQDHLDHHADDQIPVQQAYDGYCAHKRAYINDGMRRLVCRECDADLDPFDFLSRLSKEMESWRRVRRDLQKRARVAEDRLQEILRLERNARGRLKRIEKKEKEHGPGQADR